MAHDQLSRSGARPAVLGGLLGALAGGLLTGSFAAWAYYDDTYRPLSHTFGLWIVLLALLSARRPVREAVARSVVALAAAVLAFYVGKDVMYGIEYPGMPYAVNGDDLVRWLVLSLLAGSVLVWIFCRIGRQDLTGALGTAAAVGLLVADAARRAGSYDSDRTVVTTFALLAVLLVLAVGVRSLRQLAGTAAWTVPMAAAGLLLVAAPDLLEQFLLTGLG